MPGRLLIGGPIGYVIIEGWTFFESIYMTVISLTTVGYGEIPRELSSQERIYTMFLLIRGLGTLAYGVSTTTAFLVEGRFTDLLTKRKMDTKLEKLKDHHVLCGLGETGRYVAEEFIKTGTPFVAIEQNEAPSRRGWRSSVKSSMWRETQLTRPRCEGRKWKAPGVWSAPCQRTRTTFSL